MQNTTISATDLQALLDVSDGFTTENDLDAVARYAVPQEVQHAINHGKAVVRKLDDKSQSKRIQVLQS